MPFQKLQFRPGIVRDTTSLANEGGWYACDKVRFRLGFPEKIGGWSRISSAVFQGICRSLSVWTTLVGVTLYGIGTHLKMYVALGGLYYDITPLRTTLTVATNAFTTSTGSNVVVANVTAHGAATGDFVTVTAAATAVGGITADQLGSTAVPREYQVTVLSANTFSFVCSAAATSPVTGGNGTFAFQIAVGVALAGPSYAWGSGTWGSGTWGQSGGSLPFRIWNQVPYGELLVYGQAGGPMYLFTPTVLSYGFNRGVAVTSLGGASSVPLFQNLMRFSPAARILVLFGTNSYTGGGTLDPMLVRWADSDSVVQWAPAATNLAGEYRLSKGSAIVAAVNARQDTLILTDTAAYLMQFIGAPYVFGFTQQSDNISIISQSAAIAAQGVVYWMGLDKFYVYDGRVQPLACPLRNEIFNNINTAQYQQVFAGTNEAFDEVWWFYPSAASQTPDLYIIYNYVQKIWYYGSMSRTAWVDASQTQGPLSATTFGNIVTHEVGLDDNSTASPTAITSYVKSADFDIGDGQSYAFIRKILPDVNFAGSVTASPTVYVTVQGRKNPGGNVTTTPANAVVNASGNPITRYTDEISLRIRARQINVEMRSTDIGVKWQFGTPRIEVRPDGRAA
jgi:hypothetical protein